jgi:uncharacterized lipoprotein YbaY/uncharacterized lipoprotein NlpE involved in copper resistance
MIGQGLRIAAILWLAAASAFAAENAAVEGVATYRERVAMPPEAVFEAVLADVSRADAPSVDIGRVEIRNAGNPPYQFRIPFDRSVIDPRHVYAVRASVRIDGRLRFTTDTHYPVLTQGAPAEVDIVMVGVGDRAGGMPRETFLRIAESSQRPRARSPASPIDAEVPRTATAQLRGLVSYLAEDAHFVDCRTGKKFPIAMEGEYTALEHAYLAAGAEPDGELMASFEGRIVERAAADGEVESVVHVSRFVGVWPGEACEGKMGSVPLFDTDWRIISLGDFDLSGAEGQRRPQLRLGMSDGPRFAASVGCNQMVGGFDLDGEGLSFGAAATTRIACPPLVTEWEVALTDALAKTAAWRIADGRLELLDADGAPVAVFVPAQPG